MALNRLLRHTVDVLPVIDRREAAWKIRKFDAVRMLFIAHVNIDRMRNGYSSGFLRVLELDVAANLMRFAPAL